MKVHYVNKEDAELQVKSGSYTIEAYSGTGNFKIFKEYVKVHYCDGWYVVHNSKQIQYTDDPIFTEMELEYVKDSDVMTSVNAITSLEDLKAVVHGC